LKGRKSLIVKDRNLLTHTRESKAYPKSMAAKPVPD